MNSRGINMRVVETTTCVLHSQHKNAAAKSLPSRLVTVNADGSIPAEPKGALNSVYEGREERRQRNITKNKSRSANKQTSQNLGPKRIATENSSYDNDQQLPPVKAPSKKSNTKHRDDDSSDASTTSTSASDEEQSCNSSGSDDDNNYQKNDEVTDDGKLLLLFSIMVSYNFMFTYCY